MIPEPKLDALVARHQAVERELASPVTPETYVKLSREFAELAPIVETVKDYRAVVADKGRAHAKPVTLCGELASKPIGALALVAIGYRSFSLSPSAVGPVKAMLLDLNAGKAAALMQPLIDSPSGSLPIRERLKAFAAEEGLQI